MTVVVLLGPPGAGKGTVAEALIGKGYRHVSTGELLREQIRLGTPLGLEAKKVMEQGRFVPDDVVVGMIRELIQSSDSDAKFLMDGFPRTLVQAEKLDGLVQMLGGTLGPVFLLECSDDVIVNRLSGRRSCVACGTVYHLQNNPPAKPGVCDLDGSELVQRSDDTPETIKKRLEIYLEQTAPLVDYYTTRNLVRSIDAMQGIEKVRSAVLQGLDKPLHDNNNQET